MEANWQLEGSEARLGKLIVAGMVQDLDEARAVGEFQDAVNRLGVQPKFQELAARNTPAAAVAGPRIG